MRWFRPFIVSLLAVAVTAGFFLDKIEATAFATFATGLIVFWFKSRDSDKAKEK